MTDEVILNELAELHQTGHELNDELSTIDPATVEYAETMDELSIVEYEIARLEEIAG